jgi:hypothetical protein
VLVVSLAPKTEKKSPHSLANVAEIENAREVRKRVINKSDIQPTMTESESVVVTDLLGSLYPLSILRGGVKKEFGSNNEPVWGASA